MKVATIDDYVTSHAKKKSMNALGFSAYPRIGVAVG